MVLHLTQKKSWILTMNYKALHGLASSHPTLTSSPTTLSLTYAIHSYLPPCWSSDMPKNMLLPQGLCTCCTCYSFTLLQQSFSREPISWSFIFLRSLPKYHLSVSPCHYPLSSYTALFFSIKKCHLALNILWFMFTGCFFSKKCIHKD